jgi:hypothetical protein
MVNRADRDRVALALRRLASGRITNREFEDRAFGRSQDAGVRAVVDATWALYDDLREHRLTGKDGLTAEERRQVAQAVLFLHSNTEYRWPASRLADVVGAILSFATAGWIKRSDRDRSREATADRAFWPFFKRGELIQAGKMPRFLVGS